MLGNTRLDHPEEPPPRPTDYVIRHILHVSRPNSNVGSEWPKSTRIIDWISQRGNRQDQSAEAAEGKKEKGEAFFLEIDNNSEISRFAEIGGVELYVYSCIYYANVADQFHHR
jgi:hypothetical protein